jgi:hypothetical protein
MWRRQGLDGALDGASPREALSQAGWARSIGGVGPYVAFKSRTGSSRAEADAAVANVSIHELPSARGCTYVVPQEDYALALRLAQGTSEPAELSVAKKHLGVTDAEMDRLCEAVLDALQHGPADPKDIRGKVGDAVRSLGDEGKKRGQTSTLPLALGMLQLQGSIRRVPTNGRLDQQRYAYALWTGKRPQPERMTFEEALATLAAKYFQWIGPAKLKHFQWFTGVSAKHCKTAMENAGIVPVDAGEEWWIHPSLLAEWNEFHPSGEADVKLLSSVDSLLLLQRDLSLYLDQEDASREGAGEKALVGLNGLADLPNLAICDRGRIIGLWEFDAFAGEIVWMTFDRPTSKVEAAVAQMGAFVKDELGDARSFSLDSPESRRTRVDLLRQLSAATSGRR